MLHQFIIPILVYLAIFLVDLLGFIIFFRYIKISYSKGGICEDLKISIFTIIIALIPGINLILGSILWIIEHPSKEGVGLFEKTSEKFFNIKK